MTPSNHILDEDYLNKAKPISTASLAWRACGSRASCDEAYGSNQCPVQ